MNKLQHTTGPWVTGEVFNKEGKAVFFIDKSKGGEHKRRLDNAGLYSDDDANLIAAAPELLAELEKAHEIIKALQRFAYELGAQGSGWPYMRQSERGAAIDKAKGE